MSDSRRDFRDEVIDGYLTGIEALAARDAARHCGGKVCGHCGGYVSAQSALRLCVACAGALSPGQLDLYQRTGIYPAGAAS